MGSGRGARGTQRPDREDDMTENVADRAERRGAQTTRWLRAHGYALVAERYDALDAETRAAVDRLCSVIGAVDALEAQHGVFSLDEIPEARAHLEELQRLAALVTSGRTP